MEEEKGAGAAARQVPRVLGQNRHETLSRTEAPRRILPEQVVCGENKCASRRNCWPSPPREDVLPTAGHN